MNIRIKINKNQVTKPGKVSPTTLIRDVVIYSVGTYGSGYKAWKGETFVACSWNKVNKKVKSSKKVKKIWNGKEVTTTKRTYEPAKWICNYYLIPIELLKIANMNMVQCSRTFKLIPR